MLLLVFTTDAARRNLQATLICDETSSVSRARMRTVQQVQDCDRCTECFWNGAEDGLHRSGAKCFLGTLRASLRMALVG